MHEALKRAEARLKDRPADTLLNHVEVPVIQATIALRENRPDRAIELLQPTIPYERRYVQAVYLRGLAYLRLGKVDEAVTEFQKIIDHKGAYWGARYPLAYVGLARAAALNGDMEKSRKVYEEFLNLWKDADPDIPILIDAKNEYSQVVASR